MASADTEYSQALQHITDAKLEELSNKRNIFQKRKHAALEEADSEDSHIRKIRALSNGVKKCFDIRVDDDGRISDKTETNRQLVTELSNIDRFLKQAEYDPCISADTLERWRRSLLSILDVQTLKYEYAMLFAQLTMEWLSVKKSPKTRGEKDKNDDFEKLASTQKMESKRQWEENVFKSADVDANTITTFLKELFTTPSGPVEDETTDPSKNIIKYLERIHKKVTRFEEELTSSAQFNSSTLQWVIKSLLSSDLPTEKQRAVLREFLKDNTVLTELADVLNMRLIALDTWSWGPEVTVEQRRQLNGDYHIHMHEDLIQAIFLQYLGIKWSVFFKKTLTAFRKSKGIWKSPRSTIPEIDKKRRRFYLDSPTDDKHGLQIVRESIHCNAYFVSQLLDHEQQQREVAEGEMEASSSKKKAKQTAAYSARFSPSSPQFSAASARLSAVRHRKIPSDDGSDEDMGFGMWDEDDAEDSDSEYEDSYNNNKFAQTVMKPANPMQAKQNLLLLLGADITINQRLYGEITCFRAQYESLYPSLPHATILAVLKFLGVSEKWARFFEKFLTAPLKFVDEPDVEPRLRRRGAPGSHVLSEVFGEVTLFCLDFMVNKESEGGTLWRVNDDMWFWSRSQDTCVTAWKGIQKFSKIMGLPIGNKAGGAHMTAEDRPKAAISSDLPSGKIRWGMLYLNSDSSRFEIDQEMVDCHIDELKHQLQDKEVSIFSWIQAWNAFASTFFTYNFGTPANCFGQQHVEMMLQTHERIQRKIFSSKQGSGDHSVITYLRETIQSRFGNTSIPDGYFFLPIDLGGLELSSPFINLVGLRDSIIASPNSLMDDFFRREEEKYTRLKRDYLAKDKDTLLAQNKGYRPDDVNTFMSFEEYTRHRDLIAYAPGRQLVHVYDDLLRHPPQKEIGYDYSGPISVGLAKLESQNGLSGIKSEWDDMSSYWKWVVQLYGPEIVDRFGGFNVVDPGLLPIGLVSQFRSGRVSWREE
ncbi:hypothetical protein PENSTE_c025G08858 [Penicillium steckii]|uniref:Reverse transcriptase domain-containing protein n=1 Tax=Penicillium steckii TaxID=303698 RepID=A0A1V6SR45_9EURO|nr:hypothetical protein PENSTE_c025G08858 [Penicillium steckii]